MKITENNTNHTIKECVINNTKFYLDYETERK